MKRILILVEKMSYSGASKIAFWLAESLAEAGNDVTLMSRLENTSFYAESETVRLVTSKKYGKHKLACLLSTVLNVRAELKRRHIDVMISFLPLESALAIVSSVGTKVPVIIAERSDPYFEKSTTATICRYMCRFADGAVFQTERAKEYYPKRLQEKSCVIPNPSLYKNGDVIDYSKRRNVITYSGRLYIKQKRQDVLLKAIALVVKKIPDVRLEIYGDGPDEDSLKKFTQKLGVDENVFFMGKTTDVVNKVMNSRLFVFSSDYEGIPNSVIEALSVGTPVVSTDCSPGGVRILVDDGVNGYIVPRGDYVSLADKVIEILGDTAKAEAMSHCARNILLDFSEDSVFRMWDNYIKDIGCYSKHNP